MTTSEFIAQFRESNPRDLALQSRRYPDVDMPFALNQIQGWQTARQKLPSWAAADGVVYPPHLNMEQCSSEQTARYKQEVAELWLEKCRAVDGRECKPSQLKTQNSRLKTRMTDLTGGFGVDFSFTSRCFDEATYVERDAALCSVVGGNLPRLGIGNARVACGEAEDALAAMEPQTMIFLDPARRDANGAKTVFIADCAPDVTRLLPQLMEKSRFTMLKLSPMLDWHKAVDDLHGTVREVHIVSVGGECKELLLVLSGDFAGGALRVVCVDINAKADADGRYGRVEFAYTEEGVSKRLVTNPSVAEVSGLRSTPHLQPITRQAVSDIHFQRRPETSATDSLRLRVLPLFLYEPNASVMKAGCFGELSRAYGVEAVGRNSHLFLSADRVEGFPGRAFAVDGVTAMNKRELRQALSGIDKANIAVRNFPMSVAELRKRLKLKDGGTTYIFATTTDSGEHVLLLCRKA